DVTEQLGGKGAGADPGGIGLGDPQHIVQIEGAEAAAGGGATGGGIGGGDVGIGAVVDVQQRALGALEQDVCAAAPGGMEDVLDVREQWPQGLRPGAGLLQHGVDVTGLGVIVVL